MRCRKPSETFGNASASRLLLLLLLLLLLYLKLTKIQMLIK